MMSMVMCRSRAAVQHLGGLISRHGRNVLWATTQQRYTSNNTTGDDTAGDQTSFTIMSLEKKALKLEEQVKELKEKYRIALDSSAMERSKIKKYVVDAKLFGIQSFCKDLVEVVDLVENAKANATENGLKEVTDILSQVEVKLFKVFDKHGLQKMTPLGSMFDPYEHERVCCVPTRESQFGTVAVIKLDGYKLHGRTVRQAHVGIAVETKN